MNVLNFSKNLIRLRHEKKLTQEELADFLGVTKAAISKWENQQSLPDILLLPQLASFFDVTIDELLGYEIQLSREQIQKLYMEICKDFAEKPSEEVWNKLQGLIHRYYSCYSFLLQVVILYLNHFMLFQEKEKQQTVLKEGIDLCQRIICNCTDIGITEEATAYKAVFQLQLGEVNEVIETLEPLTDLRHLALSNENILIQAYQMTGKLDKADSLTQFSMYLHLMNLIAGAVQYLNLHITQLEICQETIRRVQGLIDLYNIKELSPNTAMQFYYQAAIVYAVNDKVEELLEILRAYQSTACILFRDRKLNLHGDDYFNRLNEWLEQTMMGAEPPRNIKIVAESAVMALDNPLFQKFQENAEIQKIKKMLKKEVLDNG